MAVVYDGTGDISVSMITCYHLCCLHTDVHYSGVTVVFTVHIQCLGFTEQPCTRNNLKYFPEPVRAAVHTSLNNLQQVKSYVPSKIEILSVLFYFVFLI
jgi:hypothetical protein